MENIDKILESLKYDLSLLVIDSYMDYESEYGLEYIFSKYAIIIDSFNEVEEYENSEIIYQTVINVIKSIKYTNEEEVLDAFKKAIRILFELSINNKKEMFNK